MWLSINIININNELLNGYFKRKFLIAKIKRFEKISSRKISSRNYFIY